MIDIIIVAMIVAGLASAMAVAAMAFIRRRREAYDRELRARVQRIHSAQSGMDTMIVIPRRTSSSTTPIFIHDSTGSLSGSYDSGSTSGGGDSGGGGVE